MPEIILEKSESLKKSIEDATNKIILGENGKKQYQIMFLENVTLYDVKIGKKIISEVRDIKSKIFIYYENNSASISEFKLVINGKMQKVLDAKMKKNIKAYIY